MDWVSLVDCLLGVIARSGEGSEALLREILDAPEFDRNQRRQIAAAIADNSQLGDDLRSRASELLAM